MDTTTLLMVAVILIAFWVWEYPYRLKHDGRGGANNAIVLSAVIFIAGLFLQSNLGDWGLVAFAVVLLLLAYGLVFRKWRKEKGQGNRG